MVNLSPSEVVAVIVTISFSDDVIWNKRYVRKRRRLETRDAGADHEWDVHPALRACDSDSEAEAIWYEKNVAVDHIGHIDSALEASAKWYEENIAGGQTWDSSSGGDYHGMVRQYEESERGRARERRPHQQQEADIAA
jgi:hypothetical protein